MTGLSLILLAAGDSTRFKSPVKKQWLRIGDDPLWSFVTKELHSYGFFDNIVITAHPDEVTFMHNFTDFTIVEGGKTRQQSLLNALSHTDSEHVLVSDIARPCIDKTFLQRIISAKDKADCIVPFLKVSDTVVYGDQTVDREQIKRIQTPQLSRHSTLLEALSSEETFTDESSAIVAKGGSRFFIEGDSSAEKITFLDNLSAIPCLSGPLGECFTGNGFDVHPFEEGKTMVLGGVEIDSDVGFAAHSDGDVAIHALIDALLGAAGLGDIGMLFPDTDTAYKGIDSKELLLHTVKLLGKFGYEIIHCDITIIAQKPRVGSYKNSMRQVLSSILGIPKFKVNVKATTTEKLGFIGRKEGVAVNATATLKYFDWTEK